MSKIENGEIREIGSNIIWQDRKHHLWFPISFTKYSVGDGRLYINSGLLSSREDECLLYRITEAYRTVKKDFSNMMKEYSYNHGDLTELWI